MKATQTSSNTQEKTAAKKRQQSFLMDIGTPKVPLRKSYKTKQEHELLSDWEHAS